MMNVKKQSGISMIEILVTVIVIAVGLLGVAVSQSVAVKETGNSAQRTAAVNMVNDLVERMRMNRLGINDYRSNINGNCPTSAGITKVCGTTVKSKSVSNADANGCTVAEKAKFDLWESFCDRDNREGKKGKSGNRDYMAGARLLMRCEITKEGSQAIDGTDSHIGKERREASGNSTCKPMDIVKLELTWKESKNKRKKDASLSKKIIMRTAL